MKKLLLVAMLAMSFAMNAQETRFGITGGFNSTNVKVSTPLGGGSASVEGFYAGFFADIKVSDKFSIQPELNYVATFESGESLNTLTLPILAKYYVAEKFNIQAGPTLDYILDETGNEVNAFGFGLATGLGFDFTEDLFATVRYSFGLSNRLDNDIVTSKIDYLQVGIGYKF